MSLNKTVDSDISRQDDSAHTDHVVRRKRIKKAREQAQKDRASGPPQPGAAPN